MKKILFALLVAVLMLSLTACGKDSKNETPADLSNSFTGQNGTQQNTQSSGLTLLCNDSTPYPNCFGTESGFYYFTQSGKIADDLSGMHLMYIDYATQKEIYLCSDSGCRHDSEKCSSVYGQGDFGVDSIPFVWGDFLYVLGRGYDSDGSASFDMMGNEASPEAEVVTLYRMNLDGSSRQQIYTFPDNITTEKLVFGDGDNLWFVTKKLETQSDANGSYTTSTDRSLSKYSISENKIVDGISLDFGDSIYQTVIGASGNTFVLNGVAYPEGLSEKELIKLSDEDWKKIYKNSSTVYASLDAGSKNKQEICRMENEALRSTYTVKDGYLFASDGASGSIIKIDLSTGEKSTFATLSQNYIYFTLSDALCCLDTGKTDDKTLYFVDTKSGEVRHSTLTNQSLGYQLEVLADAGDSVLVVYDYDATKSGDQYVINQYKYALISKGDLYSSQANYMPIAMAGSGK